MHFRLSWSVSLPFIHRHVFTLLVQSAVREKISLATKSGPGNERRNALKSELDGIREKQSSNKASRGKILDQVKSYQESISKKVRLFFALFSLICYNSILDQGFTGCEIQNPFQECCRG